MPTILDTKFAEKLPMLLAKLGVSATFTVVTSGGVYDEATSTTSATTDSLVPWLISPPEPYGDMFIDGEIIQAGDMKTFLSRTNAAGTAFTPTLGQRLSFGGKTWVILGVHPIYTGELVGGFELQLRSGAGGAAA